MSELLQFKGRLLEQEQRERELKLKANGLRDSIRALLDPFQSLEDLKTDQTAQQALELAQVQIEYAEVLKTIDALKRAIGH